MSNAESTKTLTGVALALTVGYYIFKKPVLLDVVLVLLVLAAFPCRLSRVLSRTWLRFAEFIGGINSRIILTLIFSLVLVPVSFFYRRSNRGMVDYYGGKKEGSLFLDAKRSYDREMFEKTW